MIILLIITISILIISNLTYLIKYKSLQKKTKDIISDLESPLRRGYMSTKLTHTDGITLKVTTFHPNVFVKEIDRFTNGECKLEIEKIEPGIAETTYPHERVEEYVKGIFHSVHKISDVNWLETEISLKEIRKSKLEKLKSIIGK
jgi:hypothetical protein